MPVDIPLENACVLLLTKKQLIILLTDAKNSCYWLGYIFKTKIEKKLPIRNIINIIIIFYKIIGIIYVSSLVYISKLAYSTQHTVW